MRTICILVLALAPAAARGQGPGQGPEGVRADPIAGEAMFREGRRLLKAGDIAGACDKLDESHRLDPAVGTLANLADCEERLGRLASAWEHWRWVADKLPASDRRRTTALARASALEKRVPRLTVDVAGAETAAVTVERDGVPLGKASWGMALPLDPGPHRIVVRAPGRKPLSYDVAVTEGEQRRLQVAAGPAAEVTPPPVAETAHVSPAAAAVDVSARATPAPAPRWRRFAGYSLLGAGALGLGAATYFGVEALRSRSAARKACPGPVDPPTCWSNAGLPLARDRYFSRMTDVSLLAGTAAAAAGGYLLLTGRERELSLAPTAGGAEVAFAARF